MASTSFILTSLFVFTLTHSCFGYVAIASPGKFAPPSQRYRSTTLRMLASDDAANKGQRKANMASDDEPAMQAVPTTLATEEEHLTHQRESFDLLAPLFRFDWARIPDENVSLCCKYLARRIVSTVQMQRSNGVEERNQRNITEPEQVPTELRLLDVGCGSGLLFPFLLEAADSLNVGLSITGVDLSDVMVDVAKEYAKTVLAEYDGRHKIVVVGSDIKEFVAEEKFDGVVFNACFSNFWDPDTILQHTADMLNLDAGLFISHPQGGDFVRSLNAEESSTVPHILPSLEELRFKTLCLPLEVTDYIDGIEAIESDGNAKKLPLYFASAKAVRHRTLSKVIRLRGMVDSGYGRGGKKLGFPTANLPSRLFQDALEDVPAGVYFGWAVVEDVTGTKKGRNIPQKAVVNVGFSPTFEGQENAEKVVEAFLILDEEAPMTPPDFYNETMRLQLHAFLRPEIKFASFPALVAQIKTDVVDSKQSLSSPLSDAFRSDEFLSVTDKTWIGGDGGDDVASWDFEDVRSALGELPDGIWLPIK